jgi:hypothetical protein
MKRPIIEPLGVEVNQSGHLHASFPSFSIPNVWESLPLKRRFLAQVVQCLGRRGYGATRCELHCPLLPPLLHGPG